MLPPPTAPPDSLLASTRERIDALRERLAAAGVAFRMPPPLPTTCCGRGCNGCVWESYFDAAAWWCEDARALLPPGAPAAAATGT